MTDFDAVIIGAGHNGLICASYLAKAGKRVLVVDGRSQPGGCASTRELTPGVRVSDCAQWLHQFDDAIASDLDLKGNGLQVGSAKRTIALQADGDHLVMDGDLLRGAGISTKDQVAYKAFRSQMGVFAKLMLKLYRSRAPKLVEADWTDRITLMKLGLGLKLMGKVNMQDLMRIVLINIYDVMNEHFDHEGLKAALALDAITGTNMGPRSPNTVFTYMHRAISGQLQGSGVVQVLGGMGSLGNALLRAAETAGATVRLGAEVTAITKTGDRVTGVVLGDGSAVSARAVVSSADPTTTFRDLLGYQHLETGTARRASQFRNRSGTAKLHLVLSALPGFTGLDQAALGQRLVIAPSMDAMESAFNPMKYNECGPEQVFDISIPTVEDPGLADGGQHVLSALVHYLPYAPKEGWEAMRQSVLDGLLNQLEAFAPGLKALVTHAELLVPPDFEASYGMTGGNWHHGELAIDQALMTRPFPGSTQYATSVAGLYLCGAGAHPGGSLMGLPGSNAAREMLKQGAFA